MVTIKGVSEEVGLMVSIHVGYAHAYAEPTNGKTDVCQQLCLSIGAPLAIHLVLQSVGGDDFKLFFGEKSDGFTLVRAIVPTYTSV